MGTDKKKDNYLKQKKRAKGKIPSNEISVFCAQITMLLKAGIPLHEGLKTMIDNSTGKGGELLGQIADEVELTGSLYEAVKKTGAFPMYMTEMIHIGETVGRLEDVLSSLSAYYERDTKIRSAVRSAVLYPVILVFLMAAVISVLIALVLPVFSEVLSSMGVDVNGNNLMGIGMGMGKVTLIVIAALLVMLIIIFAIAITRKGRALIVDLSNRLPYFKKLYSHMTSSRFATVMAMMLSSGFDMDQSLEMAADIVPDKMVKSKILMCRQKMSEGIPFSDALLEIGLFSGLYSHLIKTGERSGRIDEVMDQLAVKYSEQADESMSSLISIIEPSLVILLSVIIGAIILSVMLPLVEIMSNIG